MSPSGTRLTAHEPLTRGEHVADNAAGLIGSWPFIIWQSIVIVLWVAFNGLTLTGSLHFDAFPYILLNLALSCQAAMTGPILLLASNRQSQKDREMATQDDQEIALLLQLQQEQLEILRRLETK